MPLASCYYPLLLYLQLHPLCWLSFLVILKCPPMLRKTTLPIPHLLQLLGFLILVQLVSFLSPTPQHILSLLLSPPVYETSLTKVPITSLAPSSFSSHQLYATNVQTYVLTLTFLLHSFSGCLVHIFPGYLTGLSNSVCSHRFSSRNTLPLSYLCMWNLLPSHLHIH